MSCCVFLRIASALRPMPGMKLLGSSEENARVSLWLRTFGKKINCQFMSVVGGAKQKPPYRTSKGWVALLV